MPKGYKTLSIKDESWDYAKALFSKQSNQSVSFSSWVSEFLQLSVQRDLFFEYMSTGLAVMDYEIGEIKEIDADGDKIIKVTVIDKNKKEFVELVFDPLPQSTDNGRGYYCQTCKSKKCPHAFFVVFDPNAMKHLAKLPNGFLRYLQKFLKENKEN